MPNQPKRGRGRPTLYTPELATKICRLVAEGSNLDVICRTAGFPGRDAVYSWLRIHPEFGDEYARARIVRADSRSDRIDDYARRVIMGDLAPDAARVAIDAEKWQAAHEAPKRYGDKVTQEITGADGGAVKIERVEFVIVDPPKDDVSSSDQNG